MRLFLIAISFSLFIILNFQNLHAQEKFSKKAEKYLKEGDKLSDMGLYAKAEPFYLKAIAASKSYRTAYQRIGNVYLQTKQYKKAYDALNNVIKIGGDFPNEVYFKMAQTCFALGKFKEADDFVFQYSAVPKMSAARKQELQELKDNLAFAKEATATTNYEFTAKSVGEGINTINHEYFPSLTADGEKLFFTRNIISTISQEDIFQSNKTQDNTWDKSTSISNNINTSQNEGAQSISADGRKLYLTLCEHQGGYGSCDIYVSERVGNEWSQPKNLGPQINTEAKETQPCISADGMALYFVSSRPGGYGKLDIYMCYKKPDGNWANPINLGSEVNSAGIDERPFIHPDNNTLYFSSDGRKGFGNGDLYMAKRHQLGSKWNEAVNMGFPINSFYYEGGVFVTTDGSKGYFATDRMNEDLNLDIYEFAMPTSLQPEKITYVKGKTLDAATQKPLAALIEFIDLETGKKVNATVSDAITGEYLLTLPLAKEYVVNALSKNYLLYSENFSLKNKTDTQPYIKNMPLQKIEVNKELVLENVFFAKDSFLLKATSYIELNKLVDFLGKNNNVNIEISGHTDNTGNEDYNLKLSEQRAKSVYDYLLTQKVNAAQITYKGYGDKQPLADNNTEEGKAKNRRTAIKIVAVN